MTTAGEIKSFLDSYKEIKFGSRKRDISKVIESPEKYKEFLSGQFNIWNTKTKTLYSHVMLLTIDDIVPQQASSKFNDIIDDLSELVGVFVELKSTIGPVTFEDVVEDLSKKVQKTIEAFDTVLEIIVGDFPYDIDSAGKFLNFLRQQVMFGRWGNKSIQVTIDQVATKPLPEKREFTYKKHNKFSRAFLDFGNHIWILSRMVFLILFFSFTQTQLSQSIQAKGIWVEITLWVLLGIWMVRSVRKKKFSVFLTGVIVWGISLAWFYGYFPSNLVIPASLTRLMKITLWFTVIFWFPVQFLNVIRDHRASQVIVLLMIWSGILSLFSYGIGKGILVAVLLLIIPTSRFFGGTKSEQQNLAGILDKRLYIPTAISLLIVALFVTKEGLWLTGAIIWIMFSITATHSYKYFRKSYDLIEELYPNPRGKRHRHLLLFITLTLSTALLFPGFLGKLNSDFVLDLYTQSAGLAFGLITILLAVQAIIPGINTWSAETRKANRLREMRSILRANAGLEGFMQWFFVLFILSLSVWFLSTRFLSQFKIIVDLSSIGAFELPINFIDELKNVLLGQGLSQSSLLRISTLAFGVFVYVAIYGVAQLYYLFVATNTLTLPIRDSILSNPVEIEAIRLFNAENDNESNQKKDFLKKKLQEKSALNGHIINQLSVFLNEDDSEVIESIKAEFELDFVEMDELLIMLKNLYSSLFGLGKVQVVNLSIARRTFQRFSRQPVFDLEVTKSEWDFLRKEIKGFPLDYKLRCLNARLSNYVMAESQIA